MRDTLTPISVREAYELIFRIVNDYPSDIRDCFQIREELGSLTVFTSAGELCCFWCSSPEKYPKRVPVFKDMRSRIEADDRVRRVVVEDYREDIRAGYLARETDEPSALLGQKWRVAFNGGLR